MTLGSAKISKQTTTPSGDEGSEVKFNLCGRTCLLGYMASGATRLMSVDTARLLIALRPRVGLNYIHFGVVLVLIYPVNQ